MNRNAQTYLWALLLTTGLLASCKDDFPADFSLMTITETILSDASPVYKTEQFTYADKKLTSHATTQVFVEQSLSQTTAIAYVGNEVTIAHESGHTATYTLGADGYATQCTYQMGEQTREYTFAYTAGYLTRITETIDGAPTTSNALLYHNGNLMSVSIDEVDEIACTPSRADNYSQLPELLLADVYPLSFHIDAMYAHLLGKPTQHLVGTSAPVVKETADKENPYSENTTYEYATNEQKRVTNIEKVTAYRGIVYDKDGQPHLTTNTALRSLTISYQ